MRIVGTETAWSGKRTPKFIYINNYVRARANIVDVIRRQALRGVDLSRANKNTPQTIVRRCKEILRRNLPKDSLPAKVREFESIFEKTLWVPTVKKMPRLDGDLSDPIWKSAAPLVGWTERAFLTPSEHRTLGGIMRVGDKLVLGITFHQT